MARLLTVGGTMAMLAVALGVVDPVFAQVGGFGESADVVAIEVPVQVIRDGKPVTGLTAEDFEIVDGRKKRVITAFEEINLSLLQPDPSTGAMPLLPVSSRRHFLFLFDLSFSQPDSVTRARQAAKTVVKERVHPTDLMAVGTYSGSAGFRLVLGFTSDRGQVAYAIDTMGLAQPLQILEDPLGLLIAELEGQPYGGGTPGSGGGGGGGGGVDVDAELLANLRDAQGQSMQNTIDQQKNQMLALTSSMEAAAGLLRAVDGRVQVILLSEGFDTSVMLGIQGTTQVERDRLAELADDAASGETWLVRSDELYGSGAAQTGMGAMIEEFRRADAVINAVDIGGLRVGGTVDKGSSRGKDRENSLFVMANGTGGELFRNTNDLGAAMSELLERTSVTYVLVFQPPDLELDGEYHRLKVKLKEKSKGTRLVHRPGYYAPKPFDMQTPIERRMALAGLVMGGRDGGSFSTSVLAVPVGAAYGEPYVPVLIEVDGKGLIEGTKGSTLPTEVYAYAIDSAGSIRDFFTRALGVDLAKHGEQIRQTGFKFWGELDLEPGDYVVRVLVRNSATGATNVSMVSLVVPNTLSHDQLLLPPLFPEPPGKWLMARELNYTERSSPFPFMMNDESFFPASRPVLRSSQPWTICLMGIDLAARSFELSGQILGADDEPLDGAEVLLESLAGGALPDQQCSPTNLTVSGLRAGDYVLEVTAKDVATGDVWSSSIPVGLGV